MISFKDKKIAVVGLGIEGLSSIQYLKKHGAEVTELDKKQGEKYLQNLDQYDLIIRSPGIKPELLKIDSSKITSQTKLFFDLCPCPIIGVTGTKGKGTTSSLIFEMLKKEGRDVYLGGNIGKAPFEFLDKLTPQSIVVLELSSFQLVDFDKSPARLASENVAGRPYIAVILMTTSEHLDWHKDIKEYIDAKRNILKYQSSSDFAIVNRDYPASLESDIYSEGKVFYVSRERAGYDGCFISKDKIAIQIKGQSYDLISTKEILLPGKHNLENVCAAVLAATLAGVWKGNIVSVLKTFKGLEHRLALVREVNGVKYYDDSFSTTPETAIAAIEAFKIPEILILGGSSKSSDFTELGRIISSHKNIKAIIGIGKEWPSIRSKISKKSKVILIEGAENMKTIVLAASKIAKPGDVVLLTPACASFDMFANYKDRGELFKKEVNRLP